MSEITFIRAWPRDASGAEVPVYLAGGGSHRSFRLGDVTYRAGVINRPRFRSSVGLDANGFTGGTIPAVTAIGFEPADPAVGEALLNLAWKDARIEIDGGDEDGAMFRLLTGAISDMSLSDGLFSFTVADMSQRFAVPIIAGTFAGTGDAEGYDGATGRAKRRSFGLVRNVEGRLLDPVNSIYEFGDPAKPLQAITTLRDMGREAPPPAVVTWQGSVVATLIALRAATAAQGSGVVAPSIACAKWWTDPAGPLTADIQGEAGASYTQTVAGIASRLVELAGGAAITNRAEAEVWRGGAAGIHIDSAQETYASALDRLTLGASLIWRVAPDGSISLSQWSFSDPVIALQGIFNGREATLPPTKKRTIIYRANHRQHGDGEIATTATLELIGGIVTSRDPVPPESLPIGSLYIDPGNRQFRFDGVQMSGPGGAIVGIGGLELIGPGYVDVLSLDVINAEYQVDIIPPLNQTVFTDFLGAPLPSQFPRVLTPTIKRGGIDIRTAINVSYAISTSGAVTASVNSALGHPDKGRITVEMAGIGYILLTITVDGRPYGPFKIQFSPSGPSSPPSSGGTGSKSANDVTFPDLTSASLVPVAGPMTVTVGSGESITCVFPASYSVTADDSVIVRVIGQWETSPAGAGTWTAGPAGLINGTNTRWFADDYSGDPGEGFFNDTITGLAPGDYDVRFVGKLSADTGSPSVAIFASRADVLVQ